MAELLNDLAIGSLAGLAGSQALARTSSFIADRTPKEQLQAEEALEPAHPFVVLARKAAGTMGRRLTERQEQQAKRYIDHALSLSMASAYVAAARRWPLGWFTGGVVFGTLFFAVMDEGANTALGLVGDNRQYPAEAHLRGWASHVAFGVAVAAVARVFGVSGNKHHASSRL